MTDQLSKLAARLHGQADIARCVLGKGSAVADDLDRAAELIDNMAKAEPVAWAATDESGTVVEALGMNQSRRFDTALYLAPPATTADGGSVSFSEQVRRMAEDAARYRWLRGGSDIPPHSTRWARWEVRHWNGRHWNTLYAEQADEAIDAARRENEQMSKENKQ